MSDSEFQETEDGDHENAGKRKKFISGGIALIFLGIAAGAYSIAWPIYAAINKTADNITIYNELIMASVALPIIGAALLIFKEKVSEWIPTEDHQNITLKHIVYLAVMVGLFLYIDSEIMAYLESLGYTEQKSY